MTIPASQDPSLGFVPGDHVCAFYSGSRNVLDDIVVDYITKGLTAGNKDLKKTLFGPPAKTRRG